MEAIILFLKAVPIKIWLVIIGILILVGSFGYQVHQRSVAEREAERLKRENQRLEDKTEGLKILVNTANVAIEIQKEKEAANVQHNISKNANANFNTVVKRDSNSYANVFANARENYCRDHGTDSLCQR